jgi:Co/Zn/Cd efflux system component
LLIGYEAVSRLFAPVPIHFAQAIPIAALGLGVNIASAWLLSGGEHPSHSHGHGHGHAGHDHDESHRIATQAGDVVLEIFEDGVPPRFRLRTEFAQALLASAASVETVRPGDQLADLHLWRLGPGHLGAILSVVTPTDRRESFYRAKLGRFRSLSHLTIEVKKAAQDPTMNAS